MSKRRSVESIPDTEIYANTYRKDDLNWRYIVFLPFDPSWRLIIALAGILYFNIVIYEQIFQMRSYKQTGNKGVHTLLVLTTMMFIVDTVLSIWHKIWESVQKSMPYQPKSTLVLIIDFISILPIRLVIDEPLLNRQSRNVNWLQIISLNGCVRVYRIFVELRGMRQRKGTNAILVTIAHHTILSLALVSVLCSIWYTLGYVYMAGVANNSRAKAGSWLDDVTVATDLDVNSPFEMYLVSLTHVYVVLSNEVIVDLRSVNYMEIVFVIFLIYLGFLLRYGILFSSAINSFLKHQQHIYRIKADILMNMLSLKGKKQKEITNYYNLFWKNWYCLHKCPLLDVFPVCLRKDVLTDVYWDAISHSHVLRQFTINIKRQLSLVMESKLLQPGEHIFRKGEVKNEYYYVASGVVQIMSHYDGVSPIMTISNGSCLGSLSLIMPTLSATDVTCASVCEVRILKFKNFCDVLLMYPSSKKILQEIADEHIGHCKKMFVLSKTYKSEDPIMKLYGVPQDDKLKWIKRRWRTMRKAEQEILKIKKITIKQLEEEELPIEMTHTSKHLDVIVLSNEVKWEAEKCCTKSRWPYVLDPDCNFVKVWLVFICIIIIIDCSVVPYRCAFLTRTTEGHVVWDHLICFAYIFDVYFQAITGVRSVELTIMEPMRLLRHHLKNPRFLLDIVGAIPTREFVRLFHDENEISPKIALIRLCKFYRVFSFFNYRYSLIMTNYLITHVVKYFYIYFIGLSVCTCFAFMNSCHYDSKNIQVVCDDASWYLLARDLVKVDPSKTDEEKEKIAQYILVKSSMESIQFIFRYLFKSGLKDYSPISPNDVIMCTVFVFLANNLFILIASELIAIKILSTRRKFACEELISDLKSVLSQKNIHFGLLNILDSFIRLQWRINRGMEQALDMAIPSEIISPILEAEQQKIIMNSLKDIELFQHVDNEHYFRICRSFRLFTVPEGFIFCRSGDQPSSFNIIINGYCNLTSMLKEDVFAYPQGKIIGPGSSFPLMEVAQNIPCFQTTVSTSVCEVAAIDVIDLRAILYSDVVIAGDIRKATEGEEERLDVVISKKKYPKFKDKIPSFTTRKYKKLYSDERAHGKKILKYISLLWYPPFIIHPGGAFMIIWETVKILQVILTVLYMPLLHAIICGKVIVRLAVPIILDAISFIDILIRFYVGSYDKNGILIHKISYYIYHSFIIDFISTIPFEWLLEGYDFRIRFFLTVSLKSLQIYRISGYLFALQRMFHISNMKTLFLNFLIHWVLLTSIFANLFLADACYVRCIGKTQLFECAEDSCLLSNHKFQEDFTPYNLLVISFNIVITVFLGNDQSGFYLPSDSEESEILTIIIYGIIAMIIKYYYIAEGVGYLVGGCVQFTKHRENMGLYWFFIANEGGNRELASTIADHFTFQFARLRGIKMNTFIYTLHPSLQSDLTFAIYYKSMLCLHKFVGDGTSFMKRLTKKVDEIYFTKNNVIININEVSNKIYFVREGYIDVYNENERCITSFGPGSMFGSFKILENTKHKLKFKSHGQSNVLIIPSRYFFIVLKDYGKVYEQRFTMNTKDLEYVIYKDKILDTGTRQSLPVSEDLGNDDIEPEDDNFVYPFLYRNHNWYRWVDFFLSMIVPYLTIFPLLFSIVSESEHHKIFISAVYILDAISFLRIVLAFTSTYTDESTGTYEHDMMRIRLEYLIEPSRFSIDFLSCFPMEFLGYLMNREWYAILRLNRMLKLVIMIKYIENHVAKIYVRPWLRWFEFVALVTLVPYIAVCFWQYTTCINGCDFIAEYQIVTTKNPYIMFVHSLRHVITLYTLSPSYELQKPWTTRECVVMTIISITSFMLLPFVIGHFAKIAQMTNYTQKEYDYNVQCMKLYLQLRDLSESLLEAIWQYSFLIWKSDKGEIMPKYVRYAPSNMKCELVYDLYGAHILYNSLFSDCHRDFVVQLTGRLKRSIYFPSDFIIRKFDIDGRMYFINSGEVEAVEFDEHNKEIVKQVFITGQCFGLRQGLYDRLAHLITYKARSMAEVLTLAKDDWNDLAVAFPGERSTIFRTAEFMNALDSEFM